MRLSISRGLSILSLLLLIPVAAAGEELDAYELALLDTWDVPLAWDNVEGRPYVVAGSAPGSRRRGRHVFSLDAGKTVDLVLPAGRSLRVVNADGGWQDDEPRILLGGSAGVFLEVEPRRDLGDGLLLLSDPLTGRARHVRLEASGNVQLALFVGQRPAPRSVVDYFEIAAPPKAQEPLVRPAGRDLPRNLRDGGRYWLLDPGAPRVLDLEGPLRLRIESRLIYRPEDAERDRTYSLSVRLDGTETSWLLAQETSSDTRRELPARHPLGQKQQGFVDLGRGRHRLRIETTAAVYLRITKNADDGLERRRDGRGPDLEVWIRDGLARQAPASFAEIERRAFALARDNRFRNSGLAGLSELLSLRRPEWLSNREIEQRLEGSIRRYAGSHTFFRDLLPFRHGEGPITRAYFHVRRPRDPFHPVPAPRLAEQHLPAYLRNLPRAFFLPVGEPSVYPLPERTLETRLRLAVEISGDPAHLLLQLDDGDPVSIRVERTDPLGASLYAPAAHSLAFAALERIGARTPVADRATLDGPFHQHRPAGSLLTVGAVEIPLAAGIRTVKVWQAPATSTGGGSATRRIALQLLASKPHRLDEPAFQELTRRRGTPGDAFAGIAARQLEMHRRPLQRLLEARLRLLEGSVSASWRLPDGDEVPAARLAELEAAADALEQEGQWLAALELRTRIERGSRGARRLRAFEGSLRALVALGEDFVAERRLTAAFLRAQDEALRQMAGDELRRRWLRAGDLDRLMALEVHAARAAPGGTAGGRLPQLLLESGDFQAALLVALDLPAEERPAAVIARAAYQLGWWRLYVEASELLDDPAAVARQRALRLLKTEGPVAALDAFRAAGESAHPVAESIEEALDIRRRLAAEPTAERTRALGDWQAWQARQPGPWVWRATPESVTEAAGGAMIYSAERDLQTPMFRSSAERPVGLAVHGPVRLRLTARPVHLATPESRPLDGWLVIEGLAESRRVLISNNLPSSNLMPVEGEGASWRPGTKVVAEIDVPPGHHDITVAIGTVAIGTVAVDRFDVLVRAEALRPERPLGVLPPLSPATVAVLAGDVAASVGSQASPAGERPEDGPSADPSTATALRGGECPPEVTELVARAEAEPERRPALWIEGHALVEQYSGRPCIGSLYAHLRRGSRWQRVENAVASAGLQRFESAGWNPESPGLRVRKALMDPLPKGTSVVIGDERFGFAFTRLGPATLDLELSIVGPAFLLPQPLLAYYQLNGGAPVAVQLGGDRTQVAHRISVPAGDHVLRVWNSDPLVNQYLGVRLAEGGEVAAGGSRTWFVATDAEPLRLRIAGPTLIRVDELRDGLTRSRYQAVRQGWETLTLSPEDGRAEALLRVFHLAVDDDWERRGATLRPMPGGPLAAVPALEAVQRLPPSSSRPAASPALVFGGEDATWSHRVRTVRRRDLEDTLDLPIDRFADYRVARREALPRDRGGFLDLTHWEAWALYREREEGEPSFGFGSAGRLRPWDLPLAVNLAGRLFLQDLQGLESSFHLDASIVRFGDASKRLGHRPELSFFFRHLTLDGSSTDGLDFIDQDVFTNYKDDHRWGFRLSDQVHFRPRPLTELWGRVTLASNESLDPTDLDFVSLRAGWRQLLGALRLKPEIVLVHYFDDDDRRRSLDRESLLLTGTWERWRRLQRWELGARLRWDFDDDELSGLLTFALHLDRGRGFRDFRPGQAFRNQRWRRRFEAPPRPVADR